jgi:RimJ/RimL family protein N-acetyltransferase
VDFFLDALPHLDRGEIAPVLLDEDFSTELVVRVAYDEERLVGCGFYAHFTFQPPERSSLRVVVAEPFRGRGVGTALHQALLAAVPARITSLRATTYDDDERSMGVADHWGYRALQRSITSAFDLAAAAAPALPEHVRVDSYPSGEGIPDPAQVDAAHRASQTNPEVAHSGPMTIDQLLATGGSDERPLVLVLRVDGVPAATLVGSTLDELAFVSYAGVVPAYRGRHYVSLLKRAFHVAAHDAGAQTCYVENEEHNAGIRRVNAELGYRVLFGVWRRERRLP